MPSKKIKFADNEYPIFEDAVIYLRGRYWQFRLWLPNDKKYARLSLKTTNKSTAIDKGKRYYHELMFQQLSGKSYYSRTTKQATLDYLEQRQKDVDVGLIVQGRYSTIRTHLNHWLDFIGRDTKLKELERSDCENYYHHRTTAKKSPASPTTIANEQSTVNALVTWLFNRGEVSISAFDFKKIKRPDAKSNTVRRRFFENDEIKRIAKYIDQRLIEAKRHKGEEGESEVMCCYFLLVSLLTGLRSGEQKKLTWNDVEWFDPPIAGDPDSEADLNLVKITVRAETSKVRQTRRFAFRDPEYFHDLFQMKAKKQIELSKKDKSITRAFKNHLVFSVDGESKINVKLLYKIFYEALQASEVKNIETRGPVPYSFRHHFITSMINRGANPTQVAETCGTSTHEIEKTYYHTTDKKMLTNALQNFDYVDGLLIPKGN